MAPNLAAPLVQVCAFALGCALIHAARRHAAIVTAVLATVAVASALLLLLVASVASAPDADAIDPISIAEAA
ncbi:hypothetical protein [Methylobacterium radiodurans]|uniref:Uncharacterized protein n=1 Tax=Methylobacterium radiodurans TaxID=2202828 RepID=A0A2U8VTY7_9HYPH|nr:hypothetical protein [Methylobacterium radiodurans]AWN36742.1 hypothetical protein DK427_14195 [Methylobacterium radiodurans]